MPRKRKADTIFGREPVALLTVVQSVLALALGFGLELTGEQVGLIMAATAAVLGYIARTRVVPQTR